MLFVGSHNSRGNAQRCQTERPEFYTMFTACLASNYFDQNYERGVRHMLLSSQKQSRSKSANMQVAFAQALLRQSRWELQRQVAFQSHGKSLQIV